MRVLLIGSGGREHALAWKLKKSPECRALFVWPGNAATNRIATALGLSPDTPFDKIADAAIAFGVDIVVVGPEGPLAAGITDVMTKRGLKVFGPTLAAAQLESSKVFAKRIMMEASIPTAAHEVVTNREDCLRQATRIFDRDGGVVLKASGLASGKGVFVCKNEQNISDAIERLYSKGLSEASESVVIEEILFGREVSYFCLVGAGKISRIGFAVDHKRLLAGDKGPNTGGMGCYTPVPWLPGDAGDQVDTRIVKPLLETLERNGISYTGCLYVGLMWSDRGPAVVEFNVRFGDPEAQVLALSDQTDWLPIIASKVGVKLRRSVQAVNPKPVMGYVLASSGYPYGEVPDVDGFVPWSAIEGQNDGSAVFAASVKAAEGGVKTGSGRVFLIAGTGRTFNAAKSKALARVERLRSYWPEAQWRSDIGQGVLQYEEAVLSHISRLPIILGSSSPRRKELLSHLGLDFTIVKPETEERPLDGEDAETYVARNAREKNTWICEQAKRSHPSGALVLTADTIVVIDGKILEKPMSANEANEMLTALSGRTHVVLTAVCVAHISSARVEKVREFTVATEVAIKKLNGTEMEGYIETGEPFDKAGGYAAQGLGSFMVREVHGSFSNVVGLPLAEVAECLQEDFNVPLWRDR
jgi:phosphoribosylamine--glycine ligase